MLGGGAGGGLGGSLGGTLGGGMGSIGGMGQGNANGALGGSLDRTGDAASSRHGRASIARVRPPAACAIVRRRRANGAEHRVSPRRPQATVSGAANGARQLRRPTASPAA